MVVSSDNAHHRIYMSSSAWAYLLVAATYDINSSDRCGTIIETHHAGETKNPIDAIRLRYLIHQDVSFVISVKHTGYVSCQKRRDAGGVRRCAVGRFLYDIPVFSIGSCTV